MPPQTLPAIIDETFQKKRLEELTKANSELQSLDTKTWQKWLQIADDMSLRRSSALFGFLGGAIGSTAGVTISGLTIGGYTLKGFLAGGPIGAVAGIAIGVLVWRGPRRLKLERRLEERKLVLEEVDARIVQAQQQIQLLKDDAPDELRQEMWGSVRSLIEQRKQLESDYGNLVERDERPTQIQDAVFEEVSPDKD